MENVNVSIVLQCQKCNHTVFYKPKFLVIEAILLQEELKGKDEKEKAEFLTNKVTKGINLFNSLSNYIEDKQKKTQENSSFKNVEAITKSEKVEYRCTFCGEELGFNLEIARDRDGFLLFLVFHNMKNLVIPYGTLYAGDNIYFVKDKYLVEFNGGYLVSLKDKEYGNIVVFTTPFFLSLYSNIYIVKSKEKKDIYDLNIVFNIDFVHFNKRNFSLFIKDVIHFRENKNIMPGLKLEKKIFSLIEEGSSWNIDLQVSREEDAEKVSLDRFNNYISMDLFTFNEYISVYLFEFLYLEKGLKNPFLLSEYNILNAENFKKIGFLFYLELENLKKTNNFNFFISKIFKIISNFKFIIKDKIYRGIAPEVVFKEVYHNKDFFQKKLILLEESKKSKVISELLDVFNKIKKIEEIDREVLSLFKEIAEKLGVDLGLLCYALGYFYINITNFLFKLRGQTEQLSFLQQSFYQQQEQKEQQAKQKKDTISVPVNELKGVYYFLNKDDSIEN